MACRFLWRGRELPSTRGQGCQRVWMGQWHDYLWLSSTSKLDWRQQPLSPPRVWPGLVSKLSDHPRIPSPSDFLSILLLSTRPWFCTSLLQWVRKLAKKVVIRVMRLSYHFLSIKFTPVPTSMGCLMCSLVPERPPLQYDLETDGHSCPQPVHKCQFLKNQWFLELGDQH